MELRELAGLREDAAALCEELAGVALRDGLGLPAEARLPDLLKAHPHAASEDALAEASEALANAAEAAQDDPARGGRPARLAALRDFLVRVRALALDPGSAQELLELDLRRAVRPPGDPGLHGAQPPRQADRELPYVVARGERAELERALGDAVAVQSGPRTAAWNAAQEALDSLGIGQPGEAAA